MDFNDIFDKFQEFSDKFDHGYGTYSAERVAQRAEYHAFIRKTDFMTVEEYNNFNSKYAGKNLPMYVRYAPGQQNDGYYKIRFLGKIRNPQAGWEGYLPTSFYFLYQLKCTLRFSLGSMSGASFDFSFFGILIFILSAIVLFLLGISLRLSVGILLTIIHFFVSLFAPKRQ